MWEKRFSIYGVQIPQKCIEYIIFTHAPVPHLNLQAEFFENPPQTERVGGNYDLFYQNSITNYEDELEH